jgi:cytochrome c-type biogenesis protein CcmE
MTPPMTPKRKRLWLVVGSLCVLGAAAALVLTALNDNIVFFYSPTQVAEKHPGPSGASVSAGWSSRAA